MELLQESPPLSPHPGQQNVQENPGGGCEPLRDAAQHVKYDLEFQS